MANPKRRHSRSRRGKRRAHDFLTPPNLSVCSNCGSAVPPHRACSTCGFYRGRQVVEVAEE